MTNKPSWLIIHNIGGILSDPHFDTSQQTFNQVNSYHGDRWSGQSISGLSFYIGYHFFIDWQGVITQGRLETDIGWHTASINDKSIGICLAGNFSMFGISLSTHSFPSKAQEIALKGLLLELMEKLAIGIATE